MDSGRVLPIVELPERDAATARELRIAEPPLVRTAVPPIDPGLAAGEALQRHDLIRHACALVATSPMLAHFNACLGEDAKRVWTTLSACPLPPAIAARLAAARDTADGTYERAVRAAFIALFLGISARFNASDLEALATAALIHDIGMVHVDAARRGPQRTFSVSERRLLQEHPLRGQRIALGESSLDPAIAIAIAQHHERLDGSGYPHGFSGTAISPLARVLMLAELVSSVLDTTADAPALQLSIILRVNRLGLDPALSRLLLDALPRPWLPSDATGLNQQELRLAGAVLAAWRSVDAAPDADGTLFAFVSERMDRLQGLLAGAPLTADPMVKDAECAALVCAELGAMGREALWHARQIAFDAAQRWPDAASSEPLAGRNPVSAWIAYALMVTERRPGSFPER